MIHSRVLSSIAHFSQKSFRFSISRSLYIKCVYKICLGNSFVRIYWYVMYTRNTPKCLDNFFLKVLIPRWKCKVHQGLSPWVNILWLYRRWPFYCNGRWIGPRSARARFLLQTFAGGSCKWDQAIECVNNTMDILGSLSFSRSTLSHGKWHKTNYNEELISIHPDNS